MAFNSTKVARAVPRLTLATSAIALATGAPALAQESDEVGEGKGETIVVTGNLEVVAPPTQTKEDSIGVVDTLTADQIDRTPDFTLAEAATRIPGVFGTSFQGQPRFLSLRGLDARYNSVSIDGKKIFNSSENNRGSQLDIVPASLISEVAVIKATTPDIDENSIGGHISVRTLRAFDGGTQPYLKGRVQYGVFERDEGANGDDFSGRLDIVGKTTFGDGNFGIVAGLDLQQRASNEDFFNLNDGLQLFDDGSGNLLQIPQRGTARFERIYTTNKRASAFGKFEARDRDRLYSFVALNYFGVQDEQQQDRKRYFIDTRPDRVIDAEDGFAIGGRGTEAFQFVDSVRDIDTFLLSSGLDYRVGDGEDVIKLRASWADVSLDEDFFISTRFERTAEYRRPRSLDIRGDYPIFTIDPAVLTGAEFFEGGDSTYEEDVDLRDHVYTIRAEYESNAYVGAEGFGFRVGGSFRRLDRDLDTSVQERTIDVPYTFAGNRPDLADVDFPDPGIGIDRDRYFELLNANSSTVRDEVLNLGGDYILREHALAGFAMAIFNGPNYQLVGGVRVVNTDFSVENYTFTDVVVSPNDFDNSYANVLPSAHVAFMPAPDWKLRASFTQTIGRPDFEAFAFGTRIYNDGYSRTVITGNPDLEPRLSTNLDASVEYYFGRGDGLFAIGLFYKDIENEQFEQTFSEPNPADPLGEGQFRTTTFSDNGTSQLFGVEVSAYMEDFGFIHPVLEGLSLSANYTYIDAELNAVLNDGTERTIDGLRNQPDQLFNAVAAYQTGPLGFSVAYNWQGKAFSGVFDTNPADIDNPGLNDIFFDSRGRLDASVWFDVTDRLQINVAAQNITDEDQLARTGLERDLLRQAVYSEASYWFGLKFKY